MEREIGKNQTDTEEENPIADAIYAGLCEIAGAIRELAKAFAADESEPVEARNYLDGSRIK